ncbi:MAG TPA: transcriptional repressor [Patescibacteria group bacterium]
MNKIIVKHRNLEDKLMAILKLEHLLSAPEILIKLQTLDQSYNKTSVYRALDRLLTKGILCQHQLADDGLVYELRSGHHDHLQCEVCGRLEVVACALPTPDSIQGFKLSHHHLTYLGTCPTCQ